jgi:RimJ/RimL family protein N-acetyltransferase
MSDIANILQVLPYKRSLLRLVEESDAEFILSLRVNKDLCKHISKTEMSVEKQREWIVNYKKREFAKEEFYFVILSDNEAVGTIRVYNVVRNYFCWGSWIIKKDARIQTAIESMLNLYFLSFECLSLRTARIDVRNDNKSVLAIHKKMGAKIKEITELDTFFELKFEDYLIKKSKFEKVVNR